MPSEDPFDVFEDSAGAYVSDQQQQDDIIASTTTTTRTTTPPALLLRDPTCGVLTHHTGTEQALWIFVQNVIATNHPHRSSPTGSRDENLLQVVEQILQAVDDFCFTRHWMMHIGPEKAVTLQAFLLDCWRNSRTMVDKQPPQLNDNPDHQPMILVELGTYCGYSAIRIISTLLQQATNSGTRKKFHLFTVDVNVKHVQVARQLVALAGLSEFVTFIVLPGSSSHTSLSQRILTAIRQAFPALGVSVTPKIDFLLVDHDKNAYLTDLLDLQQAHLLQAGTHVAADNVVFFQLDRYRQYLAQLQQQGVVQTRLVMACLEYVTDQTRQEEARNVDLQDGMGTWQ